MNKIIKISSEFSRNPAGRYRTDGPYTGEAFREDVLHKALKEDDVVEVNLTEINGFGSSFLEEAFGGLVRKGYFTAKDLREKLKIISNVPIYEKKIWQHIESAKKE